MFLETAFLIPAALVLFLEVAILTLFYYGLRGRISVPAGGSAEFLHKLEYDHKVCRVLFPLAIVVSLVVNVSAVGSYVTYANGERAEKELSEALKPVLAKAATLQRDLVCTRNGFVAGPQTAESDKISCAQVGDFRVLNPTIDRSQTTIFKVRSPSEVVQVTRNGYHIELLDGVTTVDDLKAAFAVK